MREQVTDKFGVKRNLCSCGKLAYWWNGRKPICSSCLEKARDIKRGYAFNAMGTRIIHLEGKYPEDRKEKN